MVESLLSSFDLVEKPIKKEQLLKTFKTITSEMEENLLPSLSEIVKLEKDRKINKSDIIEATETIYKLKKIKGKSIFKPLEDICVSIDKNKANIEDLISKHASSVLTSRVLTVKDAAIIKLVDDVSSMVLFSMDLVICALAGANNTSFPKIKFKKLKEGLPVFAELVANYTNNDIGKTVDEVSKLDGTTIDKNGDTAMINLKIKSNGLKFFFNRNFINNPFYHIRMWKVDRDMEKLEALKDKRRLVELRLMELKMNKESGGDKNLQGQIEYYEEKLASIDYKIEKLQEV